MLAFKGQVLWLRKGISMLKKIKSKGKIVLIVGLIIAFGLVFRVSLDKFFYKESSVALTPPINAKDKADRLIQSASQNFFYHEFDQAVGNYKKAILLFEKRKNFARAARIYESIGDTYKFSRNSEEAKNAYLSAVEYHQKLHNKIGEGRAMKKMGEFYIESSELDEADRLIQTASQNFFYHEFDQAIENYKKAILLFEKRKNFERAARMYESIGDVHKFSRSSKEAKSAYLSAVEYHQKLHNKIGEGRAMKKMGEFYMERSELDEAGKWFGRAVMAVRDTKPHIAKAKIYEAQGHCFIKTEQISKALGAFQQAKYNFDKTGYPLGYDNISPMIKKLKRQQKSKGT